jgi:hypothetical protein
VSRYQPLSQWDDDPAYEAMYLQDDAKKLRRAATRGGKGLPKELRAQLAETPDESEMDCD